MPKFSFIYENFHLELDCSDPKKMAYLLCSFRFMWSVHFATAPFYFCPISLMYSDCSCFGIPSAFIACSAVIFRFTISCFILFVTPSMMPFCMPFSLPALLSGLYILPYFCFKINNNRKYLQNKCSYRLIFSIPVYLS